MLSLTCMLLSTVSGTSVMSNTTHQKKKTERGHYGSQLVEKSAQWCGILFVQMTPQTPTCPVILDPCAEEKLRNKPDFLQSNRAASVDGLINQIFYWKDISEFEFKGDRWEHSVIMLYDISSSRQPEKINGKLSAQCNHCVKSMPSTSPFFLCACLTLLQTYSH